MCAYDQHAGLALRGVIAMAYCIVSADVACVVFTTERKVVDRRDSRQQLVTPRRSALETTITELRSDAVYWWCLQWGLLLCKLFLEAVATGHVS